MHLSEIYPECKYNFQDLSAEEVKSAYHTGVTVTGHVEKILPAAKELLVRLGKESLAHLPFSEVTIYEHKYSNNPNRKLPINICNLLNKNIRVKVTSITTDGIYVSRRLNMLEAYDYLTTCSSALFHVTSTTRDIAFGDIGDGITALLDVRNVCKARLRNISERICKDDIRRVIILGSDNFNRFNVSYKKTFKEFCQEDFHVGSKYIGIVNEPVNQECRGYYVSITPQVSGIMDVLSWDPEINYGDKVEVTVIKSTEKGLKLRLSRKLS